MHLVVCYDVVSDRRRARLFKRLKAFVEPVQKSVFEGRVPQPRYAEMLSVIHVSINHDTDSVRIYALCNGCRGLIDLVGTAATVSDPDDDLIV